MHYVIMRLILTEKFIHVSLSTIILDIFPSVFAVTLVNLLTSASRDNEIKSPSLVLFLKILILDAIAFQDFVK